MYLCDGGGSGVCWGNNDCVLTENFQNKNETKGENNFSPLIFTISKNIPLAPTYLGSRRKKPQSINFGSKERRVKKCIIYIINAIPTAEIF